MSYQCRICKNNHVPVKGGVCADCRYMQDPYAMGNPFDEPITQVDLDGSGEASKEALPAATLGNHAQGTQELDPFPANTNLSQRTPKKATSHSVSLKAGKTPAALRGIARNINYDDQPRSLFSKWFASVWYGAPFSFGTKMVSFQLFPDYDESVACDQVVFFGAVYKGSINENNTIEVTGVHDFNHVLIASSLHNVSSNSLVRSTGAIPGGLMRILTFLLLCVFVPFCCMFPMQGLVAGVVFLLLLTNLPTALKVFASLFVVLFLWLCSML